MSTKMELFYHPLSYNSQKVRMYLKEKGISPTLYIVKSGDGENLADIIFHVNRNWKIPTIRIGSHVISDINEILKFGESDIKGSLLVPPHNPQSMWNFHSEFETVQIGLLTYGCFLFGDRAKDTQYPPKLIEDMKRVMKTKRFLIRCQSEPIFYSYYPVPITLPEDDRIKPTKSTFMTELHHVDCVIMQCEYELRHTGGPFLYGEYISILDIDLAVLINRLKLLGLDKQFIRSDGSCDYLIRFIEEMEKRESYQLIVEESRQFGCLYSLRDAVLPLGIAAVVVAGLAVCAYFLIKRRR